MNFKTVFAAAIACVGIGSSTAWTQTWTTSTIRNVNGIDYELWSQNNAGNVSMQITGGSTNANGGTFTAKWSGTINVLFRSGKKWGASSTTTAKAVGNISLDFAASWNSVDNVKMLGVYGWAYYPAGSVPSNFSNQIEYYIIQDRGSYNPARSSTNAKPFGEATIDGIVYEFWVGDRIGQPMLTGTGNFKQYFSVPKNTSSHRQSGKISVSQHFAAWDKAGMKMMDCPLYEVAMKVESYTGSAGGNGSATVSKSLLTLGGNTGISTSNPNAIAQKVNIAQVVNSRDLSIDVASSLVRPEIRVYNTSGKLVGARENQHSLQLPNLNQGIYFVNVRSEQQSHTSQVVIH